MEVKEFQNYGDALQAFTEVSSGQGEAGNSSIPPVLSAIDQTEAKIADLKSKKSSLLPIEKDAFAAAKKAIKKAEKKLFKLREQKKQHHLREKYHEVSLEGLKWRDELGYPLIAPFTLGDPEFKLCLAMKGVEEHPEYTDKQKRKRSVFQNMYWIAFSSTVLPKEIRECYQDFGQRLLQENLRRKRTPILSISSLFTGVIPEDVKEKIAIGRLGDCYFLIADFDTTPIEDSFFFNS